MNRTTKGYLAVGVVVGVAFLLLALVDFAMGDSTAGGSDILYGIVSFAAAGVLYHLDRRKQRGRTP